MFQVDVDLSDAVTFVTQITVVLFFTTMLSGFVIKKFLQFMMN